MGHCLKSHKKLRKRNQTIVQQLQEKIKFQIIHIRKVNNKKNEGKVCSALVERQHVCKPSYHTSHALPKIPITFFLGINFDFVQNPQALEIL
jgi:hypothetical protein